MILKKTSDGLWLCVKSLSGKQAMLNLANMEGGIIRDAFLGWAHDQLEKLPKDESEVTTIAVGENTVTKEYKDI